MNRDTRLMVVLGVAVFTAALASYGVWWAIARQSAAPRDPTVEIFVAAKRLEMGISLTKEHVKRISWPVRIQVPGAVLKIEDLENRGLISSVLENEPITESKLAPKGVSGLTPTIEQGMRAVSVKVNEVIGVAGFVTPGTRVDVLVTIRQERDSVSRVVVQNVKVLTAGAKYDDPEGRKQGKPIPSTVVTLMVSPPDAEKIALASSQGQIMLALRHPLDTATATTSGIRVGPMMGQQVVAAVVPTAAPRPVGSPKRPPPTAQPPAAPAPIKIYKATKLVGGAQ